MDLQKDTVIGIVGGMGPRAGAALLNSIISQTPAGSDQEHLSTILMSFPGSIGDRTSWLEGRLSTNPAYGIARVIQKLENAGANLVGIACNTSHAPRIYDIILNELERMNSQVKLLDMPYETCMYINKNYSQIRRIGVMTTNGAYRAGIYKGLLQDLGYDVIIPDHGFQNDVIHKMVYDSVFGIKANADNITSEVSLLMEKAIRFFKERQADAIILGCTELSLVPPGNGLNDMLIFDSTDIFARALIREATRTDHYNNRSKSDADKNISFL